MHQTQGIIVERRGPPNGKERGRVCKGIMIRKSPRDLERFRIGFDEVSGLLMEACGVTRGPQEILVVTEQR